MGLILAAGEELVATWLARSSTDGLSFQPQSWISFGAMLCASAGVGALAGLLLAPIARRLGSASGRPACGEARGLVTLALLAFVLAWNGAQFAIQRLEARNAVYVASASSLLLVLAWIRPTWSHYSAAITHPWCVFGVLALLPWLTSDVMQDSTWRTKRWAAIALTLGAWSLASATRRWWSSTPITRWSTTLGACALALAGTGLGQGVIAREVELARGPDAPPVVLISLDTVRAANLSVYGYARDTTPRLREFAAHATRFERAYAAANYTLPSHASMLTGLYVREHGAYPDRDASLPAPLARERETIVETLAKRGWHTIGVVANHGYLGPAFGIPQGFAEYDARSRRLAFPRAGTSSLRGALQDLLYELLPPTEFDLTYRRAEEINSAIAERLDEHELRAPGAPVFLFANYMDAHVPYSPPEPFATRFASAVEPMRKSRYYGWRARVYSGEQRLTDEQRQQLIDLYDASIAYLDQQVGALFDELRRRGLYDEALIVVTSDHGESFGSRAVLEHGMSLDEGEIRVPLLIKLPHQREPRVVDALASGVDIAPTILAQLGLPRPEPCSGVDLLGNELSDERVVFAEHYPHHWHQRVAPSRAFHETAALWRNLKAARRDDGQLEIGKLRSIDAGYGVLESWPSDAPDLPHRLEDWKALPHAAQRSSVGGAEALKSLGYTD